MSKSIVLTGGGSAGHVTPNLAIYPLLIEADFKVSYIGSIDGIERDIIKDIDYYPIRTGKLRRYFDIKNFTDPFRVIRGYFDAKKHLKKIKPDIVFSKGGFVAVPVVYAARRLKIPVVSHESDYTPGLANKLIKPFAKRICLSFPDSLEQIRPPKGVFTGSPVRADLFNGDKQRALNSLNFANKDTVLVMGGSLGSKILNKAIIGVLPDLLKTYNIIHLVGKRNIDSSIEFDGYKQFEFVSSELNDYLALCRFVISRAGSNAIHEFLALNKPMILVPLSTKASRGDQILNAQSFYKRGFAKVIQEENLSPPTLLQAIKELEADYDSIKERMANESKTKAVENIFNVIDEVIR